jgi:hypothetical protein
MDILTMGYINRIALSMVITELMKFIDGNHKKKTGWGVLKELFKHW